MPKKTPLMNRFFKAGSTRVGECLEWQGNLDRKGYGRLSSGGRRGKLLAAHRIAYEHYVGAIPRGIQVLHRCDNPKCICVAHLFLGTHADNMRDRQVKGRQPFGEKHGRSRLKTSQVEAIIGELKKGESQADVARSFGVSKMLVSLISRGKRWKHLPR